MLTPLWAMFCKSCTFGLMRMYETTRESCRYLRQFAGILWEFYGNFREFSGICGNVQELAGILRDSRNIAGTSLPRLNCVNYGNAVLHTEPWPSVPCRAPRWQSRQSSTKEPMWGWNSVCIFIVGQICVCLVCLFGYLVCLSSPSGLFICLVWRGSL